MRRDASTMERWSVQRSRAHLGVSKQNAGGEASQSKGEDYAERLESLDPCFHPCLLRVHVRTGIESKHLSTDGGFEPRLHSIAVDCGLQRFMARTLQGPRFAIRQRRDGSRTIRQERILNAADRLKPTAGQERPPEPAMKLRQPTCAVNMPHGEPQPTVISNMPAVCRMRCQCHHVLLSSSSGHACLGIT